MQTGNITTMSWNGTGSFAGYVYDNNIYTITGEQIGVNLAKYQEVEQALLKCKSRLIELGEIKVPKTPEEIIKEQSELLDKQNKAITLLLEKVDGFQQNNKSASAEHQGQCAESTPAGASDGGSVGNKNKRRCSKSSSKPAE